MHTYAGIHRCPDNVEMILEENTDYRTCWSEARRTGVTENSVKRRGVFDQTERGIGLATDPSADDSELLDSGCEFTSTERHTKTLCWLIRRSPFRCSLYTRRT